MSRFNVILVVLIGCGSSLLLVGMEKEQQIPTFNYSNPYFDQELGKTLLLLMQKNSDYEKLALHKDLLMVIAKKNYDLHCDQVLDVDQLPKYGLICLQERCKERSDLCVKMLLQRRDRFLQLPLFFDLDDRKRINKLQGEEIVSCDFDLMSINEEGMNFFSRLIYALPYLEGDDIFKHYYTDNYEYECNIENGWSLLSQDDYDKVVQLPIRLRRKIGQLCTVKVIGTKIPHYSFADGIRYLGWSLYSQSVLNGIAFVMTDFAFNGFSVRSIGVFGMGTIYGFIANIFGHSYIQESGAAEKYGSKFQLIEKSIFTPEEQENFKKEESLKKEKLELAECICKSSMQSMQKNRLQLSRQRSRTARLDSLYIRNRE